MISIKIDLGGKKWAVFAWISLLWILGTIGLIIMVYTNTAQIENRFLEAIKIALLSLGGLGVVLPTYLNVHGAIEKSNETIRENTFDLITRWDDPHLHAARKYTRRLKDRENELSKDQLIEEINKDEELKHSVVLVMNYFDLVRLSIKHGRVDKKLIEESIGPVAESINRRLYSYVESLGQEQVNHWKELQKLLDQKN